jgi:hypothetical protein
VEGSPIDPARLDELRRSFRLTLDARGQFSYEGDPLTHPGVVALFRAGLDVSETGEPILAVGEQWAYLRVEDTPLRVRHVALEPAADGLSIALDVTLDDGRRLRVPAATLRDEGERGLYVEVPSQRSGRPLRARFTNAATTELAVALEPIEDDGVPDGAHAGGATTAPAPTANLRLGALTSAVLPG